MPGRERVRGVGEAAPLPDLLEQPRRHPAAQHRVEHRQREPPVVGGRQPRGADDDVGLLDLTAHRQRDALGRDPGRLRRVGATVARQRPGVQVPAAARERVRHLPHQRVVVDPARGRDHEGLRTVVPAVVLPHGVPRDRTDRLGGAADRAAERVGAEHRRGELLVHDVARVVVAHRELLEDDAALGLQLVAVEARGGDHVTDDVDRHREVRVEHAGVVAGVLLARGGVRVAAHRVEGLGDVQGGASPGALEQQVLEEVGGAEVPVGLVPRADPDPRAHRRRAQARHLLGEHTDTAGQDGATDRRTVLPGGEVGTGLARGDERKVPGHRSVRPPAGPTPRPRPARTRRPCRRPR